MECWNNGMLEEVEALPLQSQYSNIPIFHHSNIFPSGLEKIVFM
jgi:hypothetical protein